MSLREGVKLMLSEIAIVVLIIVIFLCIIGLIAIIRDKNSRLKALEAQVLSLTANIKEMATVIEQANQIVEVTKKFAMTTPAVQMLGNEKTRDEGKKDEGRETTGGSLKV